MLYGRLHLQTQQSKRLGGQWAKSSNFHEGNDINLDDYQNDIEAAKIQRASTVLAHFYGRIGFVQKSEAFFVCLIQMP